MLAERQLQQVEQAHRRTDQRIVDQVQPRTAKDLEQPGDAEGERQEQQRVLQAAHRLSVRIDRRQQIDADRGRVDLLTVGAVSPALRVTAAEMGDPPLGAEAAVTEIALHRQPRPLKARIGPVAGELDGGHLGRRRDSQACAAGKIQRGRERPGADTLRQVAKPRVDAGASARAQAGPRLERQLGLTPPQAGAGLHGSHVGNVEDHFGALPDYPIGRHRPFFEVRRIEGSGDLDGRPVHRRLEQAAAQAIGREVGGHPQLARQKGGHHFHGPLTRRVGGRAVRHDKEGSRKPLRAAPDGCQLRHRGVAGAATITHEITDVEHRNLQHQRQGADAQEPHQG